MPRRELEGFDEGLLAALVYELSKLGVKKATRYRPHPLEDKLVLEVDDVEKLKEAIKILKEKLSELKKQLCF